MKTISETELHKMLREAVKESGSQKLLAQKMRISPQHLCDILRGRRAILSKVLDYFQLERVISYRQIEGQK